MFVVPIGDGLGQDPDGCVVKMVDKVQQLDPFEQTL
jgi:hypothetical protein